VDEKDIPGPGVDAYELFRKIDRGEIRGLIAICFNPKVSLPDNQFVTRALEKLEFFVAIDFFLSDTARHADIVLPGSLQEEDEGTVTQVEGRVIKINKAVDCPGEARQDWRIIQDVARAVGRPKGFTFEAPRQIFEELRRASKGGVADYSGVTYEKIERQNGVFWPCYDADPRTGEPSPDHAGTPRLFEPGSYNPVAKGAGPFYFPDGKARFNVAEYRAAVDDASVEYPLFLTTGRVVSQFLSGTQTRRIGPLVKQYPEPRIEMHPRLADKLGIADGEWTTCETPRGAITREPSDGRRAGPRQQDPSIQGLRLSRAACRRGARIRGRARAAAVIERRTRHVGTGAPRILRRPRPLHRLSGLRAGVQRVRHASR
jgi:assimilatory nitrate reductase catalytic subunit